MDKHTRIRLNNLAIRNFRDTADLDYIHARLAFRHKLIPQFLWSSLHALEKYGKSMLLQNLIKGKNIQHEILPSVRKFEQEMAVSLNLSEEVLIFMKRLDARARHRYLDVSDYSLNKDIVTLDRSVHQLRRFCQYFDYFHQFDIDPKAKIEELASMIEDEDRFEDVKPIRINGGRLEKILGDKNHPARSALIYNNPFFCTRKRKKIPVDLGGSCSYISQFEIEPDLINMAKEYIFIAKDTKNGHF